MTPDEEAFALRTYGRLFGVSQFEAVPVPAVEAVRLRSPRLAPPPSTLAGICSTERYDRAAHAFGKSYRDTVLGMLNDYGSAPDLVVYPRHEHDIRDVMDWADDAGAMVIPFGGGSSVVGGVTAHRAHDQPLVALDLRMLDRVLEVDRTSRAARIEAGVFGPALEAQLKPHGLTLRHFPQSFEYSTLGGWIATRSGGHFASLYTHIDDFVESLRLVTPAGVVETRRLPGSGAGPSPERMFIGSEGILGIVTQAWMRLQDRPRFRADRVVLFRDFYAAARALRAVSQAGLYPSNCRILDPNEARNTGAGDGHAAIMVLAFESADHAPDAWMQRAVECCVDHGGTLENATVAQDRQSAAAKWRNAFVRMPFTRERMAPRGIITDTFETAITWDRFEALHAAVVQATEQAIRDVTGRPGEVTCRFTHVYPDGPAPYFTFHALGRHGTLLAQWQAIKTAASDALVAAGGTITHHHAVGREHRAWYDREVPKLFCDALRAAKKSLDPKSILNPGVLIDP
jgi:alkyldihydroxyacetonephosphate synthase